jgi:hypothetical protein
LNLYVGALVLNTRYFSDAEVERISQWLYMPIDGIVMSHLRKLRVVLPFSRIKEIDNAEKFYQVQDRLGETATQAGVPRIWFDDFGGKIGNGL